MGESGFLLFLLVVYYGILVCMAIRRVDENKCLVTFHLGKVLRVSGPGFAFVWPIIQTCKIIDKSTQSRPLPEVKVTGCSECSAVSGTFEFQIFDPLKCLAIANLENAIEQTVHTTLLSVMSKATIGQCLTARSILESTARDLINEKTREWGVEVSQLTFSKFPLPLQVVKALSAILSQQILSLPLLIEEVAKQERTEPIQSLDGTAVTLAPHVQYKFGIDE
ncbi:MAG: SPFH domain-containing protein [Candidatus Melainabacteria bacterium]|nr:SPFH domain-containing protein [Candidatus Melainabacteria bacterium]